MAFFLSDVLTICKKDLRIWLTMRVVIIASLLLPATYILAEYLNAAAVGRNPVAIVNLDRGTTGAEIVTSIIRADIFRVSLVSPHDAVTQYTALQVAAIVTIPADFSKQVRAHANAPIHVQINNYNLDIANDIRRAVPDAIALYYQTDGAGNPMSTAIDEHDLRPRDIELFQYAVLPIIILLLTVNGLTACGLATTLEREHKTIKELLLSPASDLAMMCGKVLAGFLTTTTLGDGLLVLGALLGWTRPQGLYWLSALLIIGLASLLSCSLGIALGACFQRQQPMVFVSAVVAVYLFSLSGGIGVIFFEPEWVQDIAAWNPLTYAVHALQMAVFYNSSQGLQRDTLILLAVSAATIVLGSMVMRKGSVR